MHRDRMEIRHQSRAGASMKTPRLARFAVVGGAGFLVDASVLTMLVLFAGTGLYAGRAVSFLLAVSVTWWLNRRWTFQVSGNHPKGREYSGYFVVQVVGALINLGVYVLCLEMYEQLARYPVIPLAAGALLALLFNYYFSSRLVFRK